MVQGWAMLLYRQVPVRQLVMSAPSWLFFVGEGTPNAVSSASVLPAVPINASLASARSVRSSASIVDLGVEVFEQRVELVAQQLDRLV